MSQELLWILAVIGSGFVIFTPIYLMNLLATPVWMERDRKKVFDEATTKWAKREQELQEQLRDKFSRQERQAAVGSLVQKGRALLRAIIEGPDDRGRWESEIADWRSSVTEFLKENASFFMAQAWDNGIYRAKPSFYYMGASFSGDRALLASQMDLMLQRLESVHLWDTSAE